MFDDFDKGGEGGGRENEIFKEVWPIVQNLLQELSLKVGLEVLRRRGGSTSIAIAILAESASSLFERADFVTRHMAGEKAAEALLQVVLKDINERAARNRNTSGGGK